jgi:hypothetical protein
MPKARTTRSATTTTPRDSRQHKSSSGADRARKTACEGKEIVAQGNHIVPPSPSACAAGTGADEPPLPPRVRAVRIRCADSATPQHGSHADADVRRAADRLPNAPREGEEEKRPSDLPGPPVQSQIARLEPGSGGDSRAAWHPCLTHSPRIRSAACERRNAP